MVERQEQWSGRVGFILATIASAIGIGSVWKFPYEVGANGGGGFVLFYLLGLALVVGPLVLAEFALGRGGKGDAAHAMARIATAHQRSRAWAIAGALGVLTAFLILSFYSVIGGWALAYGVQTLVEGLAGADPRLVQARFDRLLAAPVSMAAYHALFMALTALIVARGIAGGIEAASKVLMPALAVLLVAVAIHAVIEAGFARTARFLFAFDPAKLSARAAIEALGLGFFSIGVGLGVMITYAAYAGPRINLRQAALLTLVGDTAISFLAGFAVFPIVFANGLDPSSGPGLIFVTLPIGFAAMKLGDLWALTFFLLLVIAALGSAISLLEMPVALAIRAFGWSRGRAVAVLAATCWLLGLFTVLSFNVWAGWFPLGGVKVFATSTFFDLLDYATSNILLPVGGLIMAVFVGWALPARFMDETLGASPALAVAVRWLLRYAAPAGIVAASVLAFI